MSTISSKQDRTYARTAQDIERKYSFGKTFADTLGLINDNRDKVDSVESSLHDKIKEQSTTLMRDASTIVMQAESRLRDVISGVSDDVSELTDSVKLKLDAETFNVEVKKGVNHVETTSGYKFDSEGLTISNSDNEMANLLNNKGMYVTKGKEEILVANNEGVKATDLHAKTYLIVGEKEGRSRFEDYEVFDANGAKTIKRTACFWIGG